MCERLEELRFFSAESAVRLQPMTNIPRLRLLEVVMSPTRPQLVLGAGPGKGVDITIIETNYDWRKTAVMGAVVALARRNTPYSLTVVASRFTLRWTW